MIRRFCVVLLLFAFPLSAQDLDPDNSDGDNGGFTLTPELDLEGADETGIFGEIEEVEQEQVVSADGAVLRALDKISGVVTDLEIQTGESLEYGRLTVELSDCR